MGGRGSSSGGGSGNNKQISALSARIAFNAAKKADTMGMVRAVVIKLLKRL